MLVQLNCLGRADPADLEPILPAVAEAVDGSGLDPARMSIVLDWVQYRKNFREPVVARRFSSIERDGPEADPPAGEIAIDVRRGRETDLRAELREAVLELATDPSHDDRVYLEETTRPSRSIIWAFNRTYWENLTAWESTFKQDYVAALPGGVSDGTHPQFWRDTLERFVDLLDRLADRSVLPEEIHVVELGVGIGEQALVWLDTFAAICAERGRDYYERLHYVLTDYSGDALSTARKMISGHGEKVALFEIDFENPLEALAMLRHKALFIHSCNLYDNLPTDEVLRISARVYESLVRAYVDADAMREICARYEVPVAEFNESVQQLVAGGPGALGELDRGVRFWADVWDAVRLEESYAEVADQSAVRVAPSSGLRLSDVLWILPGATKVHISSVAIENFVQTLTLLHPEGVFQVLDLFIRDQAQYSSFRGPGKLDGSIVNWLNGPLFQAIGERLGFQIALEPFAYREGSNTIVLSTGARL